MDNEGDLNSYWRANLGKAKNEVEKGQLEGMFGNKKPEQARLAVAGGLVSTVEYEMKRVIVKRGGIERGMPRFMINDQGDIYENYGLILDPED